MLFLGLNNFYCFVSVILDGRHSCSWGETGGLVQSGRSFAILLRKNLNIFEFPPKNTVLLTSFHMQIYDPIEFWILVLATLFPQPRIQRALLMIIILKITVEILLLFAILQKELYIFHPEECRHFKITRDKRR